MFPLFSGTPWLATHPLKGQRGKSVSTKRFSVFIRTRTPVQNETKKLRLERFRIAAVLVFNLAEVTS